MGADPGLRAALSAAARQHVGTSQRYGLTATQAKLYAYIEREIAAGRPAPSYDEMCGHMGLRSKSGVNRLVNALVERGAVVRLPNRTRALALPGSPGAAVFGIGLPPGLESELLAYCCRHHRTPTDILAKALAEYLRRHP